MQKVKNAGQSYEPQRFSQALAEESSEFKYYYPAFIEMMEQFKKEQLEKDNPDFRKAWKQDLRHRLLPVKKKLEAYHISPSIASYLTKSVSRLIWDNKLPGDSEERLFPIIKERQSWVFKVMQAYKVPKGERMAVIKDIFYAAAGAVAPSRLQAQAPWKQLDLDIKLTSGLAAVVCTDNQTDLFARGASRTLVHSTRIGGEWSRWETLGGPIFSSPSAVSPAENQIALFARGSENELIHKKWNGGKWSEWESLGGCLTSSPAAVCSEEGQIEVFARGKDKKLVFRSWNGLGWSSWRSTGRSLTSAPTAVWLPKGELAVFARGKKGSLIQITRSDGIWSEPKELGGHLSSSPSAIVDDKGCLHIFAKDKENQVIYKNFNGENWSDWKRVGEGASSEPCAFLADSGNLEVFVKGSEGQLRCYTDKR